MRLAMNLEEVSEVQVAAQLDARIFGVEFPESRLDRHAAWEAQSWDHARGFIERRLRRELPLHARALYHAELRRLIESALNA